MLSRRIFGFASMSITLAPASSSAASLKINHLRSSPEPPELAGFYVNSVFTSFIVCPRVDVALSRALLISQWRVSTELS